MTDDPLVRFAPGDGTAYVSADRLALVADAGGSATARVLRAFVIDRRPLAGVMTELSQLGFDQLAPFALIVVEGDGAGATSCRVLHRGSVTVVVETPGVPDVVFHRPEVATWREEYVDTPHSIRAVLDGTAGPLAFWAEGTAELPAAALAWHPQPTAVPRDGTGDLVAGHVDQDGQEEPEAVAECAASAAPAIENPPAAALAIEDSPGEMPAVADLPDEVPVIEATPVEVLPPQVPADMRASLPQPEPVPNPPPTVPPPAGEADDIDFANLVHHTVFRTPEDAAVRADDDAVVDSGATGSAPPPSSTVAPGAPADPALPESPDATRAWRDGAGSGLIDAVPPVSGAAPSHTTVHSGATNGLDSDHDGLTVARRPGQPARPAAQVPGGPVVHAVRCPSGHLNPPTAPTCRDCAAPIADRVARTEPRPHLGVVRFSTGQDAVVAGPIAIGRNPPSGLEIDGEHAASVAIDDSEISRYHLAVRVAEWYVSVEDQGSTNGTVVRLPGKPDQTLRPFERVQLVVGAIVELGGNVTLRYEAR